MVKIEAAKKGSRDSAAGCQSALGYRPRRGEPPQVVKIEAAEDGSRDSAAGHACGAMRQDHNRQSQSNSTGNADRINQAAAIVKQLKGLCTRTKRARAHTQLAKTPNAAGRSVTATAPSLRRLTPPVGGKPPSEPQHERTRGLRERSAQKSGREGPTARRRRTGPPTRSECREI